MSNVTYERVNWEDSPSENTPINQTNLNKMDKGIADCAAAVNDAQADIEDLNTETEQISENLNDKTSLKLATDATKQIRFGVDSNGNYGYIKDGADTVTPFIKKVVGRYEFKEQSGNPWTTFTMSKPIKDYLFFFGYGVETEAVGVFKVNDDGSGLQTIMSGVNNHNVIVGSYNMSGKTIEVAQTQTGTTNIRWIGVYAERT